MHGSKMKPTVLLAVFSQLLLAYAEPPVSSYLPAKVRTSEEENGYQYPAINVDFAKMVSKNAAPQAESRSFNNPNPTAKTVAASMEYGVPELRNPSAHYLNPSKTHGFGGNSQENVDSFSGTSGSSYEKNDYQSISANYVDSDTQVYRAPNSGKARYNYQRDIIRTYGIPKSMLNFNYDTISSDYLPPDEDNVSVYSHESYKTPTSSEVSKNVMDPNQNSRSQSYDGESINLESNDEISTEYGAPEARSSGYDIARSKSTYVDLPNTKSSFESQNLSPTSKTSKSKSVMKKVAKANLAKNAKSAPYSQYGSPNARSESMGEYGLPKDVSPIYGEPDANSASFESAERTVPSAFDLPEVIEARQFSPSRTSTLARNGITQAFVRSSASTSRPKSMKATASNAGFKSLLQFRHSDAEPSPFSISSEQYGVPSNRISPTYLPGDEGREGYSASGRAEAATEAANYKFEYAVSDYDSESDFGHIESRQYDKTQGMYHVLLPDGRKQIVEYEADEKGFKPRISYEDPDPSFSAKSGYAKGPSRSSGYNLKGQSLTRSQESKEDTFEVDSDESEYPDARSGPY